jgi:ethanolamine utilization microcompartment shell protein EutS
VPATSSGYATAYLLGIVGAVSVVAERGVAVVAQHAKALGKTVGVNPVDDSPAARGAHLPAVLIAAAVDMIESQEFVLGFTAARAAPAVVLYGSLSALARVLSVIVCARSHLTSR